MLKKEKSLSINILSVLLILISLFACYFYGVNAWFSQTHNNGVEIYIDFADLMINVYQKENGNNRLITPISETDSPSFINLSGGIVPDEEKSLELILGNDNAGSSPVFVRFKFELYVRGVEQDKCIASEIYGVDAQTATSEGFKFDEETGYYYYSDKAGNPTKVASGAIVTMMTGFIVDYENLLASGDLFNLSSESMYVVFTIDANLSGWGE